MPQATHWLGLRLTGTVVMRSGARSPGGQAQLNFPESGYAFPLPGSSGDILCKMSRSRYNHSDESP